MLMLLLIVSALAAETGPRFVILHDRSPFDDSQVAPGADIDALEIVREGVVVGHAIRVVAASIGEGQHGNRFPDPAAALGPPDHSAGTGGFVALGAHQHHLVLELSVPLRPGDRLRVHEIGASTGGRAEPVEVCFGDRETGPFTYLGQGSSVFELSFESRPPTPPDDARCRARTVS
jgi:hypothetical protein